MIVPGVDTVGATHWPSTTSKHEQAWAGTSNDGIAAVTIHRSPQSTSICALDQHLRNGMIDDLPLHLRLEAAGHLESARVPVPSHHQRTTVTGDSTLARYPASAARRFTSMLPAAHANTR